MKRPFPESYQVDEFVFAGEYPYHPGRPDARARLKRIVDMGITHFIDLTDDPEMYYNGGRTVLLRGYKHLLPKLSTMVQHHRFSIMDGRTPTDETIRAALAQVAAARDAGDMSYIHCRGGIGRTGLVVGCYLITQGADPSDALRTVQRLFDTTPRKGMASPEKYEQEQYVLRFREQSTKTAYHQLPLKMEGK